MKIIGVETVHVGEFSNLVWVRLHTDAGLIGLGETFRNPLATIAYIHETCAPALIGRDPLNRVAAIRDIRDRVGNHFSGYPTRSIEVRGNSAVDMAPAATTTPWRGRPPTRAWRSAAARFRTSLQATT